MIKWWRRYKLMKRAWSFVVIYEPILHVLAEDNMGLDKEQVKLMAAVLSRVVWGPK